MGPVGEEIELLWWKQTFKNPLVEQKRRNEEACLLSFSRGQGEILQLILGGKWSRKSDFGVEGDKEVTGSQKDQDSVSMREKQPRLRTPRRIR